MKKNKMMRVASFLLVAVLLSTSVISGTFAKYTTTGSVADTARVAKFGVVINTSGTLYSDAYAVGTGNLPVAWTIASPDASTITVAAAAKGDNVVAPGTKSFQDGMSFAISGQPEVATELTAEIKARDIYLAAGKWAVMVPATVTASNFDSLKANLYLKANDGTYAAQASATYSADNNGKYYVITNAVTVGENGYYPVVYQLTGTTAKANAKADDVAAELAKALNGGTAVAGTTENGLTTYSVEDKVYQANTDLAAAGPKMGNEKLTWEWAFSPDTSADLQDTILGDLIAWVNGSNTTGYVVYGDTYKDVSYDAANFLATNGGTVIAGLKTSVDISLTVEQVD